MKWTPIDLNDEGTFPPTQGWVPNIKMYLPPIKVLLAITPFLIPNNEENYEEILHCIGYAYETTTRKSPDEILPIFKIAFRIEEQVSFMWKPIAWAPIERYEQ